MTLCRIDFQSLPWVSIAPGAREKRVTNNDIVLRLVEFSPPFVEEHWCVKEHRGYVVDGEFTVAFRDRNESLKTGDGILIQAGNANAHKAIVRQTVLLLLMENQSRSEHSKD